jgi:hypothetical protein
MKTLTVLLLGCCLLAIAGLVAIGARMSTDTARNIAKLQAEIDQLKGTDGTPPVTLASVTPPANSQQVIKAKETGKLYRGFRVRSCPAGYVNTESDLPEGISAWCIKK